MSEELTEAAISASTAEVRVEGEAVAPEEGGSKKPFAVFPTSESFQDRLSREARSLLRKEVGLDLADLKKSVEHWKALEQQEEARRKADMSEKDRLQEEVRQYQQQATHEKERAEEALFRAHMHATCAKKGIKNLDYAMHKVLARLDAVVDGEELDEDAFLDELLTNQSERYAFGVEIPPDPNAPPRVEASNATTSPSPRDKPQPQQQASLNDKSAYDMTRDEWRQKLAALGVPTG